MTRSVRVLDRVVVLLVGLVLVAAGLAAIGWCTGHLARVWPDVTDPVRTDPSVLDGPAWPWALGVGGGLLVLLALGWLVAHLTRSSTAAPPATTDAMPGTITVDTGSAVRTAADVLSDEPGVQHARGVVRREHGELVAVLRATVDPTTPLADVARSAERVSTDLAHVVGSLVPRGRTEITVSRPPRRG